MRLYRLNDFILVHFSNGNFDMIGGPHSKIYPNRDRKITEQELEKLRYKQIYILEIDL